MHDVAAFLVRRDHRLAREIRELLESERTSRGESASVHAVPGAIARRERHGSSS